MPKAKKNKKKESGRPEAITPEKLDHFKTFIIAGCTLKEACEQIEITPNTWRNYCKRHPDILAKFHKWKNELEARARLNIAMKITNEKSVDASMYLLGYKMKLKEKAAQASLTRAKAKETKMRAELLEQQLKAITDNSTPELDKAKIRKANADARVAEARAKAMENSGQDVELLVEKMLDSLAKEDLKHGSK